jgi:hypothetical protein
MKNLKAIAAMLLGSLLLGCGCSKDDLTPKTQKGANTLSCKVNGKVFTAKVMWVFGGLNGVRAHFHDNVVYIDGSGQNPINGKYGRIGFALPAPYTGKVYSFPEKTEQRLPLYCDTTLGNREDGIFYGYGPALFKITYFDGKIVAGEFSFRGIADEDNKAEISISDGRFDIKITE